MAIRKTGTTKTKLKRIKIETESVNPRIQLAMLCHCNKCKKDLLVTAEDKGSGLGPNCERCGLPTIIKAIQG